MLRALPLTRVPRISPSYVCRFFCTTGHCNSYMAIGSTAFQSDENGTYQYDAAVHARDTRYGGFWGPWQD